MPGPSNKKKKQKVKGKEKRSKGAVERGVVERTLGSPIARIVEEAMLKPPFLHDPGNGPRVRDVKTFLKSSFSQPVAQEDALCMEFGQPEVLEMLMTVLAEETALVGGSIRKNRIILMAGMKILWYNKSRAKSRICPACLRLYNIGDKVAGPGLTRDDIPAVVVCPRQLREQELSGICGCLLPGIEKSMSNESRFGDVFRCSDDFVCGGDQVGVGIHGGRNERGELAGAGFDGDGRGDAAGRAGVGGENDTGG
jgi:hypothetical protein